MTTFGILKILINLLFGVIIISFIKLILKKLKNK